MKLTYYYDICSMWCALADEVVTTIKTKYGARVSIDRKIALINNGNPMDAGLEQELWYYDRCEATTGKSFDHRWISVPPSSSKAPLATKQF
jgi:protein-disulfide isomerase-like protein with CxxC motif